MPTPIRRVTVSGNISSDCFGGQLGLQTLGPVAVAAGELCPNAGQISVTHGDQHGHRTYGAGRLRDGDTSRAA